MPYIIKSKHILFLVSLYLCLNNLVAQDLSKYLNDDRLVTLDSNHIENTLSLEPFFEKLKTLDKKTKQLNIVHIGDSHLQAPYFPNTIRTQLQTHFGNAGYGFVFPYRVAQTNGGIDVKFKAIGHWHSVRNVKSNGNDTIGLSGILLETNAKDFLLELSLRANVKVDSLQLIVEDNSLFKLYSANKNDVLKNVNDIKIYTIKSGDNLSKIAKQFKTSISKIKAKNGLKSDAIFVGKILNIPTENKVTTLTKGISFIPLPYNSKTKTYSIPRGITQFYIKANKQAEIYRLDGVLLKNKTSGIQYSAIGVNGAKYSDYNKFPRFFEQLKSLKPDLIILSLGTNESFYNNYSEQQFEGDLQVFKSHLTTYSINASILVTSPPPSMLKRKKINDKATQLSHVIKKVALTNNWAFYNLHNICGTSRAMPFWVQNKLASKDKIHFTKQGYILQAYLLVEALLQNYMLNNN